MNRVTNDDVKRLVRLAESPALKSVHDVHLLDKCVETLGVALDTFVHQLAHGVVRGAEAEQKFARVEAACGAFVEQSECVRWQLGAARTVLMQEVEDEELQGLLMEVRTSKDRMH